MRILFLSDIHGVPSALEAALAAGGALGYDKIVTLGDLLYHGPRNGVPNFYDPVRVAQILNGLKDRIIAVRGNCDAEVDQMVLPFPIMADSNLLMDGNRRLFFTHGHVFGPGIHNSVNRMPLLNPGDALLYGHTHIKVNEVRDGITIFNPGSVGIPKDGTHSYGVYEDGRFEHRTLG
jgi:putative phosphoesterase